VLVCKMQDVMARSVNVGERWWEESMGVDSLVCAADYRG
jgi:hypothetical protein